MPKIASGKKCMIVGCENIVKANDLCAMHYQRSLRHGHTDETRPRKGVCSVDGCDRQHTAKGLCATHYYRLQRTGTLDDPSALPAPTCDVDGCVEPHVANGYCQKHYMRFLRHGDVVQTRASDWGARERHPLYRCWNALLRYHRAEVCERWQDLWSFVEDIGDSRPSKKHTLQRRDETKMFTGDNVYWREPRISNDGADQKAAFAQYMREWRVKNNDRATNSEIMKRYGIGLSDYNRMFDKQGGVCAICGKEETRVDHRTKKVSRLAIDHDHATNKVRGLLCHGHNNSLGHFNDDPKLLTSAIAYLAKHSDNGPEILAASIAQLHVLLPTQGSA